MCKRCQREGEGPSLSRYICECVEISSYCCGNGPWDNVMMQYSEFVLFLGCTGVCLVHFLLSSCSVTVLTCLPLPPPA